MTMIVETSRTTARTVDTMRATVFHGPGDIRVEEVPRPHAGPGEAVVRVTTTTICGTDIHILKGEYAVRPGLVIGHEPVGVIDELGVGVTGYEIGQRVLVGAITPCGQCRACLSGDLSQCGHGGGYEAIGGWRFGNTIDGAQAEYLLVPAAQANLTPIPDEVSDEQVVLLADIASTGFSGAESGQRADRRCRRRLRARPDRPVRDCRDQAVRRFARSSASTATRCGSRWPGRWGPTSSSTSPSSM